MQLNFPIVLEEISLIWQKRELTLFQSLKMLVTHISTGKFIIVIQYYEWKTKKFAHSYLVCMIYIKCYIRMLVPMVDTIFADVAQPDQARIVAINAQYFLKVGGHFVISIKVGINNHVAICVSYFWDL